MNNLEALYALQKEIIVQYSGEEVQMTDEERKALEALFDRVNRAIETAEKSENEKLRIASENGKAKKILIAEVREYDYSEVNKEIEDLISLSNTYVDMDIVAKERLPENLRIETKEQLIDFLNEREQKKDQKYTSAQMRETLSEKLGVAYEKI